MRLALVFQPGKRMSLEEIEREAAAEIQSRVDSGKPASEEWAALGDAQEPLNVDVSGFREWESEVAASSSAPTAGEAAPMAMPAADAAPARKPAARKPAVRKPAARKPAAAKPAAGKPTSATKAKAKPAARRAAGN